MIFSDSYNPTSHDGMFNNSKDPHRYDDIISLSRPISKDHMPMSSVNRAAQFSPFAALTSYDDKIKEAMRLTDNEIYLDENVCDSLDYKLKLIENRIADKPMVNVKYFIADATKDGGSYHTITKNVKKIDTVEKALIFTDNNKIYINNIIEIEI